MSKVKRGGRPKLDPEGSSVVAVRLPDVLYDQAYQRARKRRMAVSDMIREALSVHLRAPTTGSPR